MHGGIRDIVIGSDQVSFTAPDGEVRMVAADNVIVAMGASGDNALAETLRAAGFAVETVGDCNGVGYIEGAIRGAADAVARLLAA
jgi:hypothetical protein